MWFKMKIRLLCSILLGSLLCLTQAEVAFAQDVNTELNGISLAGRLDLAGGGSVQGQNIVILIHGTLESANSPVIMEIQQGLKAQGISSLAITLSLGFDQRQGDFDCALEQDHRHEDAVQEIGAWVNWLKTQKAGNISLLGYERGANQAALYVQRHLLEGQGTLEPTAKKKAAPTPDKNISKLVLVAPLSGLAEMIESEYMAQFNQPLAQNLQAAQSQVEQENANALLENIPFLKCLSARVTASGFLNYYQPNPNHSLLTLMSDMKKPTLLLMPSSNPLADNFKSIIEEQIATRKGQLSLVQIQDNGAGISSVNMQDVIGNSSSFLKK